MELTEIHARGQDWWTLGFESTGPADLLRSELEATAALMFAQALPGGLEPGPDESRSYAQWLGQRPAPGATPAPDTVPLPSQLARRSPAPRGRLLRATRVSVPS